MGAESLKGLDVLIVDDEEEFAATLAGRLELRGMRTRCANSGEAGLSALHERWPDILLLDMRMPVLSGLDVLRQVRVDGGFPNGPKLPVLIVSGHCSEPEAEQAAVLGIQEYLAKHLDFGELLAAMAGAVDCR